MPDLAAIRVKFFRGLAQPAGTITNADADGWINDAYVEWAEKSKCLWREVSAQAFTDLTNGRFNLPNNFIQMSHIEWEQGQFAAEEIVPLETTRGGRLDGGSVADGYRIVGQLPRQFRLVPNRTVTASDTIRFEYFAKPRSLDPQFPLLVADADIPQIQHEEKHELLAIGALGRAFEFLKEYADSNRMFERFRFEAEAYYTEYRNSQSQGLTQTVAFDWSGSI